MGDLRDIESQAYSVDEPETVAADDGYADFTEAISTLHSSKGR